MRAKVTKQFNGVKDGEIYPQTFLPGDEVTGDLAWEAQGAGNADWIEEPTEADRAAKREMLPRPLPPQPNNPPSPAAYGQAGLPPNPQALSHPAPGSEASVPALATADLGASVREGPDTPSGGKIGEDLRAESDAAQADVKVKKK
jgi:hypothetical protein